MIPRTLFTMPLLLLYGQQLILSTRTGLAKEIACPDGRENLHRRKLSEERTFREYRVEDV